MRVQVAGPVKAYRGQTVRIHASLRKGMQYAFCELHSSVGGFEPSPHVPLHKMQLAKDRPAMVNATFIRLNQAAKPVVDLELVADETCRFYLMQDVDAKGDPLIKGRIRANDRIKYALVSACRWLRRRLGR